MGRQSLIYAYIYHIGSNKNAADTPMEGAMPAYLLDRENITRSKILSNTVKQKRKEKAGKWSVPIPKVCMSLSLMALYLMFCLKLVYHYRSVGKAY